MPVSHAVTVRNAPVCNSEALTPYARQIAAIPGNPSAPGPLRRAAGCVDGIGIGSSGESRLSPNRIGVHFDPRASECLVSSAVGGQGAGVAAVPDG